MDKQLLKQDINFLEKPLWVINKDIFELTDTPENGEVLIWDTGDFKYIAPKNGAPTKFDGVVLACLLMESQSQDWNDKLHLSIFSITKKCGFEASTYYYNKIKQTLNKWRRVELFFKDSFYKKKEQEDGSLLAQVSEFHCGVIDTWWQSKDKKTKGLHIRFSPEWLQIIRESKYYKLIDFEKYKTFTSPIAARLYEILIKSFESRAKWEIGAVKLAEKITMKEQYASDIKKKITSAVNQINRKTDLKISVESVKLGRGRIKFIFQKNYSAAKIQEQDLPLVQPKRELKAPEKIFELIPEAYRPDCIVISNKIYEEAGEECLLGCIRYVLDARKKTDVSNFGGYMRNAYKHGYWRSFVAAKEKQAQIETAQKAAQETKARAKREEAAAYEAEQAEIKRRRNLVERLKTNLPDEYEELRQIAEQEVEKDETVKKAFRRIAIDSYIRKNIDIYLKVKEIVL